MERVCKDCFITDLHLLILTLTVQSNFSWQKTQPSEKVSVSSACGCVIFQVNQKQSLLVISNERQLTFCVHQAYLMRMKLQAVPSPLKNTGYQ